MAPAYEPTSLFTANWKKQRLRYVAVFGQRYGHASAWLRGVSDVKDNGGREINVQHVLARLRAPSCLT
jgi:hypothetical protein